MFTAVFTLTSVGLLAASVRLAREYSAARRASKSIQQRGSSAAVLTLTCLTEAGLALVQSVLFVANAVL